MRFERSIYVLAVLGTLAFLIAGFNSYGAGLPLQGLETHLLGGLVITAGLLLPHLWMVFYLLGTGRALRAAGLEPPRLGLLMGLIVATLAALGGLIGSGVLGGGTRTLPNLHDYLFYLAIALQVVTLVYGWRVLRSNAALFDGSQV